MGFAASGGRHATRQLAAVRGVGPRRVSLMAAAPSPGPAWSRAAAGDRGAPRSRQTQRSASEPAGPTVAADDAPTSCLGDNGTASLPWALSTATCSAQVRRPASRPSCPSFPASSQPQRPTLRADKSARGQPRHAATSPTARFISAHFHWRKSVPHPVTEYQSDLESESALIPKPYGPIGRHHTRTRLLTRLRISHTKRCLGIGLDEVHVLRLSRFKLFQIVQRNHYRAATADATFSAGTAAEQCSDNCVQTIRVSGMMSRNAMTVSGAGVP